jgi:hypothetical protein
MKTLSDPDVKALPVLSPRQTFIVPVTDPEDKLFTPIPVFELASLNVIVIVALEPENIAVPLALAAPVVRVIVLPETEPTFPLRERVPAPPEAAIVIDPAPFVTVTPVPAVIVERTGAAPVDPIGICPFVAAPKAVMADVPFPRSNELAVSAIDPVPPLATVIGTVNAYAIVVAFVVTANEPLVDVGVI